MNNDKRAQDAADTPHTDDFHRGSEEFDGFEETAAALGLAAEPINPPDALRARLMAQIALTPQLSPNDAGLDAQVTPINATESEPRHSAVTPPESVEHEAQRAESTPTNSSRSITPGPAERRAARRWAPMTVGIVSAAAAVALFFGGVVLGQIGSSAGSPDLPLAGQTEELVTIAAAADSQRAIVKLDDGGSATLMWSGELGQSALFVDGLPKLSESQSYQLWYIGASGPISAGILEQDTSGPSWKVLDGQMTVGDLVGVTVEPAGGSEQPTSDPVIAIQS